MGLGAINVNALGAVTAPSALVATVGTAYTVGGATLKTADWGVLAAIPIPSLNAVLFAHGYEGMRHAMDGASHRTGLLAPQASQTAASTAVAAAATLTFAANPMNNDQVVVGNATGGVRSITFRTALDTTGAYADQVLIGANLAATIANLTALVNDTAGDGSTYYAYWKALGVGYPYYYSDGGPDVYISATTGTTAVFTALTPGPTGNSYNAAISAGSSASLTSFGTGSKMTGGAVGTGSAPKAGDYVYAYAYYRAADGAMSAASPLETLSQSVDANVNQTGFVDPVTRDAADYFRWFRSTTGEDVLYRGEDVATATGEPYVDDIDDDTLISRAFSIDYDPASFREYEDGNTPIFRAVASWRGRAWGFGGFRAAQYSAGTASVTEASYTVTLATNTRPSLEWVNRTFRVSGDTDGYLVNDVDESARTLTLNLPYAGSTNGTASYTVTDERDLCELWYSEPTSVQVLNIGVNNWPGENSLRGISSKDPAGGCALIAAWGSLVALTRTGVWRVVGDTGSFAIQSIGDGFGCFGPRCVVEADGVLYWLGPDGIFTWSGSGDPMPLSNPPETDAGGRSVGIQGTIEAITRSQVDICHAVLDPTRREIRWYVPLDGSTSCDHAIIFDLTSRVFSLDDKAMVTCAEAVVDESGRYVVVEGDEAGCLWQTGVSTSDGAYGFEPKQAVSSYSAATRTVTVSGTPFPTTGAGLAGVPVVLVTAAGEIEINKVATNTSSTLVFVRPFVTAPTSSDVVVVGGIVLDLQTGRFDYDRPEVLKWLVATTVTYAPQSAAGRVWCAGGQDATEPAVYTLSTTGAADYADLSATDGEHHFWLYTPAGRRLRLRMTAVSPGVDVSIASWVLSVRMKGEEETEG